MGGSLQSGRDVGLTDSGSAGRLKQPNTNGKGPGFWGGCSMKRLKIHQWRDWLLEYVGDDKYELIRTEDHSVFRTIVSKNAMDAENECQRIIKSVKEDRG